MEKEEVEGRGKVGNFKSSGNFDHKVGHILMKSA